MSVGGVGRDTFLLTTLNDRVFFRSESLVLLSEQENGSELGLRFKAVLSMGEEPGSQQSEELSLPSAVGSPAGVPACRLSGSKACLGNGGLSHSHCLLLALAFRKVAIRLPRGTKERRVTGTTKAYIMGNPAPRPPRDLLRVHPKTLEHADHTRPCVFYVLSQETSLWQNLIYKLDALRINSTSESGVSVYTCNSSTRRPSQ